MPSAIEGRSQRSPISREELADRRAETIRRNRIKKAAEESLIVAGVVLAFVGAYKLTSNNNRSKDNPAKAELRAKLISTAEKTDDPKIIIIPYSVSSTPTPKDLMLSEVAADLHPLADGQNANEELEALRTYVSKKQQKTLALDPGQRLRIVINTATGDILPKPTETDSADDNS
ncbi:MAG: hypothetical protein AAB896_03150 [Patescibacteria group bacterium]